MSARFFKWLLPVVLMTLISISSFYCTDRKETTANQQTSKWLNVYDTSVSYVGMQTCRGCHAEIYETFIQTGMGQSFDLATKQKSFADFGHHAVVYDTALDFYYKPYWENDSLYFMEFRLEGKDTVHKLVRKIDYIIGSGQHTNSHIYSNNGYLYQAPITFYTQKGKWDLAPGFEEGANSRFARMIEAECMTCHNGYPQMEEGSLNKYTQIKTGIDCERCHGPGSLHVAQKQAGIIVDTSQQPDYTIVNPKRLSTELQNSVCQRCHLQGIAVLKEGKSFFDFRPGMHLKEVMNVFMPQYEGGEDKMIMASHVERMKKSECFISSRKMSCITCHQPHVSVKFTPVSQYNNACKNCHSSSRQNLCTEKESIRLIKNNNCVTCHMPKNSSIDIPHVAVTDHYIRKKTDAELPKKISAFLGLKCFNNDHVGSVATATAYMRFFEEFNPAPGLLDSAFYYLSKEPSATNQTKEWIRLYFLKNDFQKLIETAETMKPNNITDGWTCYRIGEAYQKMEQLQKATLWYQRAVAILPLALDFKNKYASSLLLTGNIAEAKKQFEAILSENPWYVNALINLGYVYMQEGNATMSYNFMQQAALFSPDEPQNLINLAIWYHQQQQYPLAEKTLVDLLKKHPSHEQAKAMLADLKQDL